MCCEHSWNTIQPSIKSKDRTLSSLVIYGCGQGGCDIRQMQFSGSRSSLALQEYYQFYHHEIQGHNPPRTCLVPHRNYIQFCQLRKKDGRLTAKGVEFRVSGHKDTCLFWVLAALNGKVFAYLLLCFNSLDHCQTMCESTNLYCTLKEQASYSVL